jgi:serine/threonine protein kinase
VAVASVYKMLKRRRGRGERPGEDEEVRAQPMALDLEEAWKARVAQTPRWSQLRRYRPVRLLGRGSHAKTLLLVERHGRLSVLKESELLPEAVNEARLLSQVQSPNVVRVEDFFIELLGHRHIAYLQLEYW